MGSHFNNGVQGHTVQLSEFWQKVNGIESGAENSDAQSSDCHADQSTGLGLADMVNDGCGEYQTASDKEIGEITDKGSGGSFQQELQKDLDTFTGNCGGRSQIKAAQQYRDFRKIQLVKFRGKEDQREIQNVQYSRDSGTDAHDGDTAGRGELPPGWKKMFCQMGKDRQCRDDEYADTDKQ